MKPILHVAILSLFTAASAWALEPPIFSNTVVEQISALQAEKAGRSLAQQKVESQLLYRVKKQRGETLGAGLAVFENGIAVAADGRELVDIQCRVNDALVAHLAAAGAQIESRVARFGAIRARVPLASVEALAAREDVRAVRTAAGVATHVGPTTSAGDTAHRSAAARTTFAAMGQGMKVGVLSDSVDSLAASQAAGELGVVTVLPGQTGTGSSEGVAMLEIVHDLAPNAELFFATATTSEAQFAQNILDLRAAGCDILVDDVTNFHESPFQDGPIARAVAEVVADGALYFSAAGDNGNKNDSTSGTWEGDFVDGGATAAPITLPGRLHNFGGQNFNTITTGSATTQLYWADPLGHSANDYDLFVLDSTGATVVGASTNVQNGTQDPFESLSIGTTNQRIVVVKATGAASRFLRVVESKGRLGISTAGASWGHSSVEGAFCVAAVPVAPAAGGPFVGGATNPVETFSSDGLRRIFYQADGTPITPGNFSATGGVVRQVADIAAADGVATSVAGFNPFFGTSASAAHAAAVAAQVWGYNRALTPAQVKTALTSTALDIEAAGVDRDSGAGIVMAFPALQSVAAGPVIVKQSVAITTESITPANSVLDVGELVTITLALRNDGKAASSNILATLRETGGVQGPSAVQNYGVLAANGGVGSKTFSFRVNAPLGTNLTATFQLTNGGVNFGTITHTFFVGSLGVAQTFSNAAAITINDNAVGSPYPSTIIVPAGISKIGKVRVTLKNFTHTYPTDTRVLLVGPTGATCLLMSAVGGVTVVSNVTFTLDDAAVATVPAPIVAGTYKPTPNAGASTNLTGPAPVSPYGTQLSVFNGLSGTGTWSLYVLDSASPDSGSIATGWSLELTPTLSASSGANQDAVATVSVDNLNPVVGEVVSVTGKVSNAGTASTSAATLTFTSPAGFTFTSGGFSQGSLVSLVGNVIVVNFGTITAGAAATLDLKYTAKTPGAQNFTASVAVTGAETITANNSTALSIPIGQANLAPTNPPGAASTLVLSTATGTSTDAATITASDTLFLDFAAVNNGAAAITADFITGVVVDGVDVASFTRTLTLAAGGTFSQLDLPLGSFAPGAHALTVTYDRDGQAGESNESDNSVTKLFSVAGPNLAPVTPAGATELIVISKVAGTSTDSPALNNNDPVFVDFAVINNGTQATGADATVKVFLDGNTLGAILINSGFAAGQTTTVADFNLGGLAAGSHTITVVLDSTSALAETDEMDNTFSRNFIVNAVPTITAIATQNRNEDSAGATLFFTVSDAETASADLLVSVDSSNAVLLPASSILLGGAGANRTVTFAPAANQSGSTGITLIVSDGNGGTASTTFLVNVAAVNDAPTFTKGLDQTVIEDADTQSVAGWATAISTGPADESAQAFNFIASSDNNALFAAPPTVAADGTLSYRPAANVSGSAIVSVSMKDIGGTANGGADTSAVQAFRITVLAANDAPTFAAGANQAANEDSTTQTVAGWATAISAGPSDEGGQTLTFHTSADQPALFSVQPAVAANGTLTYTPAANGNGVATVSVQLQDSGGTANNGSDTSGTRAFTITINAVNDAPSFIVGSSQLVFAGSGPQTVPGFASAISAGSADEAAQTLSFSILTDRPELFTAGPAISPSGTLTYTPVSGVRGIASIAVQLTDSGGASSAAQIFSITVAFVNIERGTYNGLAQPAAGATAAADKTGLLSMTVAAGGQCTGKLQLGAKPYSFLGSVQASGAVLFGPTNAPTLALKRKGLPSLTLALHADTNGGTDKVTGTISDGANPFAVLDADRALYTAALNPVAPFTHVPAALLGKYTALFAAQTPALIGLPANQFPQGDGIATITVATNGSVKVIGSLADGTKIGCTNFLSKANTWPLFILTDKKKGSFSGLATFRDVPTVSDFDGHDLRWFKPAGAVRYHSGWPGGIHTDFVGAKFSAPVGQPVLPSLSATDADGNAALQFTSGGLSATITKSLNITPANKVTVVPPNDEAVMAKITAASGGVSGQFIHPVTQKPTKFQAVILQKQALFSGYFLSPSESGAVSVAPK